MAGNINGLNLNKEAFKMIVGGIKQNTLWLIILLALFTLAGCLTTSERGPRAHYSSNDDMGVFVFRNDGVFGYKFVANFDFYDQSNLPPGRGHWNLKSDGTLDIKLDESSAKKFRVQWHQERIPSTSSGSNRTARYL
jgi:hypothetical protein